MEYRNKTCVVVRSRTSARWDWAVDLDERTVRGGQAASKRAAIKAAERLIDSALAPRKQKLDSDQALEHDGFKSNRHDAQSQPLPEGRGETEPLQPEFITL